MKSLIEERFGMLAFMEKLQRNPRQAELSQRLLDSGLSPALTASWWRACRPMRPMKWPGPPECSSATW
jgi:hypothetical protein